LAALLLAGIGEAQAQPLEVSPGLRIDFVLLEPLEIVNGDGDEEIILEGEVVNDLTSTQTLFGSSMTGAGFAFGTLFHHPEFGANNPYIWVGGVDGGPFPFEQLKDAVVPPGGSFRFRYGVIKSAGGAVGPGLYESTLLLVHQSCPSCQFSQPIAVRVTGTCDPPQSMSLDILNASPLAGASISPVRVEGCLAVADVSINNRLNLWLGVDGVTGPEDSVAGPNLSGNPLQRQLAATNLVSPCGGVLAGLAANPVGDPAQCTSPGTASWTVKFNSAGRREFALSFNQDAAVLTVADLFLSSLKTKGLSGALTFNHLLKVADALSQMPGFQQAVNCITGREADAVAAASCLGKGILDVLTKAAQILRTIDALGGVVGKLTVGQVINALMAVSSKTDEIGAALMYYLFYTGIFTDGTITIGVEAQ
jgi:hypothetical protein